MVETAAGQTNVTGYDVAGHLKSSEDIALYRGVRLEESPDDVAAIAKALGDIARAEGMTEEVRAASLSRENSYRALSSGGKPTFATGRKIARTLGVHLHAVAAQA